VGGAALADIGIPLTLLRGVVLLARCAGLLGQLAEEMRNPIANDIFRTVESHAGYVEPQY
jgi:citrate synthase